MALTKVIGEGVQGVSNASDATFLTATSSEGATFAGTLAVTGVHTIGNNAVYTSEGGSATQNVSQGMLKAWCNFNQASVNDSFNVGSVTDNGTGDYAIVFTNNMNNVHACGAGLGVHDAGSYTAFQTYDHDDPAQAIRITINMQNVEQNKQDSEPTCTLVAGYLD